MLFWIAVCVVALSAIITAIYFYNDWLGGWGEAIFGALFAIFISGVIMVTIIGTLYAINASAPEESNSSHEKVSYPLRSLGGNTVEGQYYLVGETIDEERYISYMYSIPGERENEVIMESILVDEAKVIINEEDAPHMKLFETKKDLSWIVPWAADTKIISGVEFFVPSDSILGDASLIKLNKEAKDW